MLGLLPSVVVVVAVCLFAPTCAVLLKEGEIGFSVSHLTPLLHRIEATDGRSALTAVVSRDQGLIACRVHDSMENVEKVLRYHNLTIQTIGLEEIQSTWSRCLMTDSPSSQSEARARTRRKRATPSDVIDYSGQPFPPDFSSGSPTGPGSSLAIVPGTKWCGKGNVAKTFDDLGVHARTDACCRTHDHCPFYIPALTTKYNYRNLKPWTLSYCQCDAALYNCLKNVNNRNSNAVGELFFGVLSVQCFDFGKGRYCAKHHWTQLWCETYETGPMAIAHSSPLHWETGNARNQSLIGR